MRDCFVAGSSTYLVGEVEAFNFITESLSLLQGLIPGHTSVHTDLQGMVKEF